MFEPMPIFIVFLLNLNTYTPPRTCLVIYAEHFFYINYFYFLFSIKTTMISYHAALKKWNEGKEKWCLPRKGTDAYEEI